MKKGIQTIRDIVREHQNYDTGFCNPVKIKMAQEHYENAKGEIMRRGYSEREAERMLHDND